MTEARTPTPVDEVADRYLDTALAHDPMTATYLGVPGYDDQLPDLDPDWLATRSTIRRRALRELAETEPTDSSDRITVAALRAELEVAETLRGFGVEEADLNNIGSPLQTVRDIFDLNPTASVDDWGNIAARLAAVPRAVDGYIASLRHAAEQHRVVARRQVEAGIKQCGRNVGPDGFFGKFARTAAPDDGGELPDSLHADLRRNAQAAGDAYATLEAFLRDELLARSDPKDAVGRELYVPYSQQFVGATLDLDETYEWGQAEVARITEQMQQTADRIKPGALDHRRDRDPRRRSRATPGRHRCAAGMDAAQVRRRHRGAGRHALRHPRADPPSGVPHRSDPIGRHLLHRPER